MSDEVSFQFRLRKIDETRNYLLDEIKHNDLIKEKYKNTSTYLTYVEHLCLLVWTFTGYVSISNISSYSSWMRESMLQNNPKYGLFPRSVSLFHWWKSQAEW